MSVWSVSLTLPPFFRDHEGIPTWRNALIFVGLITLVMLGAFDNKVGGLIFAIWGVAWLAYGLWDAFWPKPR